MADDTAYARTIPRRRASTTNPPEAGGRLGNYQLLEALDRGGMATIFLARELGPLGRIVAIKCIRPDLASRDEYQQMFSDEVALAAQVEHPNVCSVYDFGVDGGTSFLAMEYLRGHNLTALFSRLPTARWSTEYRCAFVARIIADACEGLHAVHELKKPDGSPLGAAHRDISPSNLFLTNYGMLKLIDFGIAASRRNRHDTGSGMVKGKLSYLPPEAFKGQKPDRLTDIWSLGVCAWELIAGERLYARDSDAEVINAILNGELKHCRDVAPAVPEELDRIIMKAVARDPAARYQSARQMGRELDRFLVERGILMGVAEVSDAHRSLFHGRKDGDRKAPLLAAMDKETVACEAIPTRDVSLAAEIEPLDDSPSRARASSHAEAHVPAAVLGLLGIIVALTSISLAAARQPATVEVENRGATHSSQLDTRIVHPSYEPGQVRPPRSAAQTWTNERKPQESVVDETKAAAVAQPLAVDAALRSTLSAGNHRSLYGDRPLRREVGAPVTTDSLWTRRGHSVR